MNSTAQAAYVGGKGIVHVLGQDPASGIWIPASVVSCVSIEGQAQILLELALDCCHEHGGPQGLFQGCETP